MEDAVLASKGRNGGPEMTREDAECCVPSSLLQRHSTNGQLSPSQGTFLFLDMVTLAQLCRVPGDFPPGTDRVC